MGLITLNNTGVKKFYALISQNGVDAPTFNIIFNEIGDITLSYIGVGSYSLTKSGLFTVGKCFFTLGLNSTNNPNIIEYKFYRLTNNVARVATSVLSNVAGVLTSTPQDALLNNNPLQIFQFN